MKKRSRHSVDVPVLNILREPLTPSDAVFTVGDDIVIAVQPRGDIDVGIAPRVKGDLPLFQIPSLAPFPRDDADGRLPDESIETLFG